MNVIKKVYIKHRNSIENFIFPVILLVYPLLKVNQGIDVSDTTYSLGNFQYFNTMKGTWMVATFLANVVGHLLQQLPFGGMLMGMYFYTGLFQSGLALVAYFALRKRIPAPAVFAGEFIALGLCWCPSTILYNYLTYLLMLAGALLLYQGVLEGQGVQIGRAMSLGQSEQTSKAMSTGQSAQTDQDVRMFLRNGKKQAGYFAAAGLCLGANVAVRMPNVVQVAFIVVVWYGAALAKANLSKVLKDTLWCILGYIIGFGVPFASICIKYGAAAYPNMVQTMFAMTEKAVGYRPKIMITSMFDDYFTGLHWLLFAVACMLAGLVLAKVQERVLGGRYCWGSIFLYVAILLVLLRFYWGRGVFSFRYYEYSSIYYPAVLLLLVGIVMAMICIFQKKARMEQKVLAMIVLVQILITPLGSNNLLYPIINNLFLVLPFMLWMAYSWWQTDDSEEKDSEVEKKQPAGNRSVAGFVWKVPLVILVLFVLVQSVGFHINFVYRDGVYGEERSVGVSAPAKAAHVYTVADNGEMLQELASFVETGGLTGRTLITYGKLPGLGYLLDMPPALSTFWADLDSYRMVEYEQDIEKLENAIAQGGSDAAPVIILSSSTAAYLSEDADAMNWFGVDREAMDADEKLQILGAFIKQYGYQEQFVNSRYAVYVCVTESL